MTEKCPHEYWERESAIETEGLCPLCLLAEVERLRDRVQALEELVFRGDEGEILNS